MAKFILLSGPSCVGKGPLIAALHKFYPKLISDWKKLVLYNSRAPRPGERDGVDYHFRKREIIEGFCENSYYLVADVRGDLQAVDLHHLKGDIRTTDIFFEGNPFIVEKLLQIPDIRSFPRISVFLSPLSREEIISLKSQSQQVNLQDFVTEVMRRKLLRRTRRQKTNLSLKDLEDIERRASSAMTEMCYAPLFDFVVPNHDGEDSENWDAFYFPLGDARRTLKCFAALLQGQDHPAAEQWTPDLFDEAGGI